MLSMMLITILALFITISNIFCAAELIGIFYHILEFSKNVSYSNAVQFHILKQWRGAARISSRMDPTFDWIREIP